MKKISVLALVALLPLISFAQKWDLEQCVGYAQKNNIQVKKAELNAESNKLNVDQAKFDYLPSLNASSSYAISFGRSLDQTTYQFVENTTANSVNSSISLGTQLFAGMSKLYSLQKSELNFQAALSDTEKLKNDISLSVAAAYLQILYGKEKVANSENQIKVLEEQLDQIKKKVAAGSLATGVQLELESQLANEKYNLVTNQNALSTSLLDMVQLLELKDAPEFDITVPDISLLMFGSNEIVGVEEVNELAQDLPQIKGAELRLKISEKDVKLAQSRYYPTISAGASYNTGFADTRQRPSIGPDGKVVTAPNPLYPDDPDKRIVLYEYYPFWDQYADNASSSINVSMQIPIFNGLTTRRGVAQARLGVVNTEYSLTQEKDKLYKEIQQARNDATGALNRYRSAGVSVESSEKSFADTQVKFKNGAATSVEYTTSKNNLITAQSMMLQAKYDYIFRIKILDYYQGIPITL